MKAFDIAKADSQPGDGDLCKTKVFDSEKGKTVKGPDAIFDASRGVFFKAVDQDKETRPRFIYKADRVRNVTDFEVLKRGVDPSPSTATVIDHEAGAAHATNKPPKGS